MRLFLAIELSSKIKQELQGQLDSVKKKYPEFSWVTQENFHITIHFFGETDKVDSIKAKIKDLAYDQENFHLYSGAVEVIANHKLLIYLTFRREKKLEQLASLIDNNFDPNRYSNLKFVPHLTLARARRSSKQQYFVLKKRMEKLIIDISFKVSRIVLFESVLSGGKPLYKRVAAFKLLDKA
jgi:2'-5' RNA ligase